MEDPRVQAMFKQTRHNYKSIFLLSKDYYELSKKTIRCNSKNYHIFQPNSFLEVRSIYQHKNYMDMTPKKIELLTTICWYKTYQPLTIDITKVKYTGRYRLELISMFVQIATLFKLKYK